MKYRSWTRPAPAAILALMVCLFAATLAAQQHTLSRHPYETQIVPMVRTPNRVNVLILGDGYTDTQGQYVLFQNAADAVEQSLKLLASNGHYAYTPFAEYISSFAFHRYLEKSDPPEGAIHPACSDTAAFQDFPDSKSQNGTQANAAKPIYGSTYCVDGISDRRLRPAVPDLVLGHADAILPEADIVLVVVNDTRYGGTGWSSISDPGKPRIVTFPAHLDSSYPATLLVSDLYVHEMGHGLALWDENDAAGVYALPVCDDTSSAEGLPRCWANITNNYIREAPQSVKWSPYYESTIPNSGVVSPPVSGAAGRPDYYRSSLDCRMRTLSVPFCTVCRQEVVHQIYRKANYVDSILLPEGDVEASAGYTTTFRGTFVQPEGGLTFTWIVDGNVARTGTDSWYDFNESAAGNHTLQLTILDNTRDSQGVPYHLETMNRMQTDLHWRVHVSDSIQATTGNDQNPVDVETTMTVPKGSLNPSLEYWVSTSETGSDRPGDSWSIVVTIDGTTTILLSPSGVAKEGTNIHQTVTIPVNATQGDVTIKITAHVQNGESSGFLTTVVRAKITPNSIPCGTQCDHCLALPTPPDCPAKVSIDYANLLQELGWDYSWSGMGDSSYFSFTEGDRKIDYAREIHLGLTGLDSNPDNFKSLRVIVDLLRGDGSDTVIENIRDTTWNWDPFYRLDGDGTAKGLMYRDDTPGYWRVYVTPTADDTSTATTLTGKPPQVQAIPPTLSNDQKSHVIEFRIRVTPTLKDGRSVDLSTTISATPAGKPLHSLWRQANSAQPEGYSYWGSRAANMWINTHSSLFIRNGAKRIDALADEHAAHYTMAGHETGTAFTETTPYAGGFSNLQTNVRTLMPGSGASSATITAARQYVVQFINDTRSHLDALLSESGIKWIEYGSGNDCNQYQDVAPAAPLPYGWIGDLVKFGRLLDGSGNVTVDLTADPPDGVGALPWANGGSSRLLFVCTANYHPNILLNRCAIGETSCSPLHPAPNGDSITITQQPQPITISYPNSTRLTVAAAGADLHYAWYAGAPEDYTNLVQDGTLPYVDVSPSTSMSYWVLVYNSDTYAISSAALVTLRGGPCTAPAIVYQPASMVANVGELVHLYVSATGSDLNYQWLTGASVDTALAIGSSRPELALTASATSTFWVHVYNDCGSVYSTPATITVCIPPHLTGPADQVVTQGQSAILIVDSDQIDGVTFTWYEGTPGLASNLVGTGQTVTTAPLNDPTTFWVRADNGRCFTDSQAANIRICYPPSITGPMNAVCRAGDQVLLAVTASSDATEFSWYEGAAPDTSHRLAGPAFGPSIYVNPTHTTSYWIRVGNGTCSIDSPTVTVSVCIPTITVQPADVTTTSNTAVTLSVTATGDNLHYQWYQGAAGDASAPISGATAPTLLRTLSATTSYWVRVTGCTIADSATATITICDPPVITSQPANASIYSGQNTTLSVAATGTNVTYTWYAGNSGDTSNPTTCSHQVFCLVAPTATTNYWVRTSGCGVNQDSATVTVTVCTPPSFTTQPQSAAINSGTAITLTTAATAIGPAPAYQWYDGATGDTSSPISGATAATYTTPALTADHNYWVRATSGICTADSATAVIQICRTAAITMQPAGQSIAYGSSATLSVAATGTNLTYAWYRGNSGDTSLPAGNTTPSLTVTPTSTVSYWARVTSCSTTADSTMATITVCTTPSFTTQPQSAIISSGTSTTLTAAATASGPAVTYQWYNGSAGDTSSPISGATGASYTTGALTTAHTYWVRATSGVCWADSQNATVSMCAALSITAQPSNQSIPRGQSVTLGVTAAGTSPTYVWYYGNSGDTTQTAGSTQSTITVSPLNTTSYWVRVTSCSSTTNSTTATVTVCTTPSFTTQPQSVSITSGTTTTLTAAASSTTGPVMTYQWYNGSPGDISSPIAGATGSSYTTPALTAAHNYWVRATTGACWADSQMATVSMCAPLSITTQPTNASIARGLSTTLSVTASGTSPSYVWYAGSSGDTSTPAGSTQASITVAPQTTTNYWVRVSSCSSTANSTTATVTVCTTPSFTTQPQSVTIWSGNSTTLSAAASSTTGPAISYQWYNGSAGDTSSPIGGATGSTYTTPVLTSNHNYWVRATTGVCTADGQTATVTVCAGAAITTQPSSIIVDPYRDGVLSVGAGGTSLSYQWYAGESGNTSSPIPSGGATLTVHMGTTTGKYWCRVTPACGAPADSNAAYISIAPTITAQPQDVYLNAGSTATFSVGVTGSYLSYHWYQTNYATSVGTNATYTTGPLYASDNWEAQVYSGVAGVNTYAGTAHLCSGPTITSGPYLSYNGSCKQIGISLTDYSYICRYEWYQGARGDISHPVGTTYSPFQNVCPTAPTPYWVRVVGYDQYNGDPNNNGDCYTDSNTLTVNP